MAEIADEGDNAINIVFFPFLDHAGNQSITAYYPGRSGRTFDGPLPTMQVYTEMMKPFLHLQSSSQQARKLLRQIFTSLVESSLFDVYEGIRFELYDGFRMTDTHKVKHTLRQKIMKHALTEREDRNVSVCLSSHSCQKELEAASFDRPATDISHLQEVKKRNALQAKVKELPTWMHWEAIWSDQRRAVQREEQKGTSCDSGGLQDPSPKSSYHSSTPRSIPSAAHNCSYQLNSTEVDDATAPVLMNRVSINQLRLSHSNMMNARMDKPKLNFVLKNLSVPFQPLSFYNLANPQRQPYHMLLLIVDYPLDLPSENDDPFEQDFPLSFEQTGVILLGFMHHHHPCIESSAYWTEKRCALQTDGEVTECIVDAHLEAIEKKITDAGEESYERVSIPVTKNKTVWKQPLGEALKVAFEGCEMTPRAN